MPDAGDTSRRTFLKATATTAGLLTLAGSDVGAELVRLERETLHLPHGTAGARGCVRRRRASLEYRRHCATLAARRNRPLTVPVANGEETAHPHYIASFSKGLPHDALGHVDPAAYAALLAAARSGRPADFEKIPMAGFAEYGGPTS